MLATLVRLQISQFMKVSDLPSVQVTSRMRSGVRRGDGILKRGVASKFAEVDVSGAVLACRRFSTSRLDNRHVCVPEGKTLFVPVILLFVVYNRFGRVSKRLLKEKPLNPSVLFSTVFSIILSSVSAIK